MDQDVLAAFYQYGQMDYRHGDYMPPDGPDSDPYVRAYQDGYDCADRLRHVLPEDIIGNRPVPDRLVEDVCGPYDWGKDGIT